MKPIMVGISTLAGIGVILAVRGYALFYESHLTEGELFWKYLACWTIALGMLLLAAAMTRAMK